MKIKLMEDSITEEEISAINSCLRSGYYTQGSIVEEFERKVASWNGSKYGIMVNSGSSANLLMVDLLKKKHNLQNGDEVLVPSVTWTTTVFPIIQNGLVPVFCDVDQDFAISLESMKRMTSEKTKAVFVVHLLGQSANMTEIKKFCDENGLLIIEDCCESMGATHKDIKVGNFGLMGSFSFYFGHHMTTVEGGMIVTDDFEIYDWLKSTRSHGWIKGTSRMQEYEDHPQKNFLFDMAGYNLRSTNINASIGLMQLSKIDKWIEIRKRNHCYFLGKALSMGFKSQRINAEETSSFCLPLIFDNRKERNYILKNAQNKGIELRPIVAGNLIRQPVFQKMNIKADDTPFSDLINENGIYLPNNQFMTFEKIDYMLNSIKDLQEEFKVKKEIVEKVEITDN